MRSLSAPSSVPVSSPDSNYRPFLVWMISFVIFMMLATIAWIEDFYETPSLIALGQRLEISLRSGTLWACSPVVSLSAFSALVILFALRYLLDGAKSRLTSLLFGVGLAGVLAAQATFALRLNSYGYLLLFCAGATIFATAKRALSEERGRVPPLSCRWEYAIVSAVILPSIFFRIYKLNVLPHYWDDELAIFNSATTSWRGTIMLGLRVIDPVGSPGFLWHLGHYFINGTLGIGILSERLLGAWLGVASILTQYLVARAIFGQVAGICTLLLCSATAIEFEWSRLPNWHGLPGIIACLLFYFSHRLWNEPRWVLAASTVILMMLAMLCYPSGILTGLIPVCAGISYVAHAAYRGTARKKEILILAFLVLVGVPLWRLTEPILYWANSNGTVRWFPLGGTHLPSLTSSSTDLQFLFSSWFMGVQRVFDYLLVEAESPSHWAPLFGSASPRTAVPSITGLGMVVGVLVLARREFWSPRSLSALAWMPLASVAAVYSTEVETRRFGTLIPFAAIVGGYGITKVVEWCLNFNGHRALKVIGCTSVSLGVWLSLWAHIVEGNFSLPQEIPLERKMTEVLKPFAQDGSIVAIASHPFRQWKMFALMLPHLERRNGEVAWASLDGRKIEALLQSPGPTIDSQEYQLSSLNSQIANVSKRPVWERLVILTDRRLDEAGPKEKERIDALIASFTPAPIRKDYLVPVRKSHLEVTIWVLDVSSDNAARQ